VQVATDASRELAKTLLDRCKTSRVSTRPATLEDVFLKLTGRTLRE
jgi:lipooligosaccharide transport system ATP-binding protein